MLENVAVPSDAYRGGYRGDNHPHLVGYEVQVNNILAVWSKDIALELRSLATWLRDEVPRLDRLAALVQAGGPDVQKRLLDLDNEVLAAAAHLHGEWVRIHPFVNGNGRTARMWVLWLTSRYGIPSLLSLRPRPDSPYGVVAQASLASGDHSGMQILLRQLYSRI
jgi:hypothetical protein